MTPDAVDPQIPARVVAIAEYAIKTGITLGGAWAFLSKVAKPYTEWRRESMARTIREVLAPELKMLARVIDTEDSCATRMETVLDKLNEFFHDHDMLLDLATDNRDRHDEMNELLDGLGLTSDRRHNEERRARMQTIVDTLTERRRERRRSIDT